MRYALLLFNILHKCFHDAVDKSSTLMLCHHEMKIVDLECKLHRLQVARIRCEQLVIHIIHEIMDDAWLQIKCRNVWAKVEKQVEEWARERWRKLNKIRQSKDKAQHSGTVDMNKLVRFVILQRLSTLLLTISLYSRVCLNFCYCFKSLGISIM